MQKSEDKKQGRKKKAQLTIRLDTGSQRQQRSCPISLTGLVSSDVSLPEEASSDRQAGSGRSHKSALRSPMPASPHSSSLPSPLEKKKLRFMEEAPETSRLPPNALKTPLAETRTSDQRIARYEALQPCTDKTGKSRNDAATAAGFNPIAAQGRRGSEVRGWRWCERVDGDVADGAGGRKFDEKKLECAGYKAGPRSSSASP